MSMRQRNKTNNPIFLFFSVAGLLKPLLFVCNVSQSDEGSQYAIVPENIVIL